jgi:hypothetical protein
VSAHIQARDGHSHSVRIRMNRGGKSSLQADLSVRVWRGLGELEDRGLNFDGLGADGVGEMVGRRHMVAGLFRSGLVFALVYLGATAALFVGSRWVFVVLLMLSQLVAVRMFVARGLGVGLRVSARGVGCERRSEIVQSVVGRAGVGRAVSVSSGAVASGGLATMATISPLLSYALADRDAQCVVAFYGSEVEALAAWRAAPDPRLELVSVDWVSGSVSERILHR